MTRRPAFAVLVVALLIAATAAWTFPHPVKAGKRHPHPHPTPSTTITPTPSPTPSSTSSLYVAPASIPTDCSSDTTAALTAWLATVPNGATAQLRPGCYALATQLVITDRTNLTIDGNSATLKAVTNGGTNAPWLEVIAGADITITNLTIAGPNTTVASLGFPDDQMGGVDYEWQHGVAFEGTQGAVIDNVTITNVLGDFIEADFDPRGPLAIQNNPPARNILIENSHLTGAGRMGIGLTDISGFRLTNTALANVDMAAVDLELDAPYEAGDHITIDHNTFGATRFSLLSNAGSGDGSAVHDITFSDNTETAHVTCQPAVAVVGADTGPHRTGYTITGNTLQAYGDAFDFAYADQLSITGNTVQHYNGGCGNYGVKLRNDTTATVTGNAFLGFTADLDPDSTGTNGITVTNNRLS